MRDIEMNVAAFRQTVGVVTFTALGIVGLFGVVVPLIRGLFSRK